MTRGFDAFGFGVAAQRLPARGARDRHPSLEPGVRMVRAVTSWEEASARLEEPGREPLLDDDPPVGVLCGPHVAALPSVTNTPPAQQEAGWTAMPVRNPAVFDLRGVREFGSSGGRVRRRRVGPWLGDARPLTPIRHPARTRPLPPTKGRTNFRSPSGRSRTEDSTSRHFSEGDSEGLDPLAADQFGARPTAATTTSA
jgi:hypothetical protein